MTNGLNEAESELEALIAGDDAAGLRLDQWLAAETASGLSRSRIKQLIEQGNVRLNGEAVTEAKRKLKPGDIAEIALPEPEPAEPAAEDIPLSVLYEDGDVIVIDKPAGLVVHPGAGNPSGTLVNALLAHCGNSLSGIGGVRRPGIVHRLDKDTSGLLVVSKNDATHHHLQAQFAAHTIERTYLALCARTSGPGLEESGTLATPHGRHPKDRKRFTGRRPASRTAVTHYRVTGRFADGACAVGCSLETGRTHQIRVHMAHIGNPLIGDGDYGKSFATKANALPDGLREIVAGFSRQALHAAHLSFTHPGTGELLNFETPLPADMTELVAGFRRSLPET